MSSSTLKSSRIASLDQFRGYTVAGMFLVNFLGGFTYCPEVLKHSHIYLSYADTIMPHFLFAVGFAFRLTFGRRSSSEGMWPAYRRVLTRFLGLMLVAIVVYGAGREAQTWDDLKHLGFWGALYTPFKREWFQTLMHIAVTAVWITPVIRSSISVRVIYLIFSGVLHIALSHLFNFEWCSTSPNVIDGGPIGILTWAIPMLLGTLVCDAVAGATGRPNLVKMFTWSIVVMAIGWMMSCGTRLYDMTDSEMADMRARADLQGKERAAFNKPIEPLAKQRAELYKQILGLTEQLEGRLQVDPVEDPQERKELIKKKEELIKQDHEIRAQIDELKKEFVAYRDGTEPFVVQRMNLQAKIAAIDNKLNGTPTYSKVVDEQQRTKLTAEKDKLAAEYEAAGAEIEKIKANPPEKVERRFREVKLALDPVFPSQARIDALKQRFEEQGWKALVAEPPFVYPVHDKPGALKRSRMLREWNYWMISQREGTLSYTTIAGGFSIFVYAIFYIVCDIWGFQLAFFRTFGTNALVGYMLHGLAAGSVKTFMPRDVPGWYMWIGFFIFMWIVWLFLRTLEKNNIYVKL